MSVYLSRLFLNNENREVRWDLGDCHRLHQRILMAFGQAPSGTAARDHFGVLYRTEAVESMPKLTRLLVQANQAPNWSYLKDGYLAPMLEDAPVPSVRTLDAQYGHIQDGMRLIFRLRANPTKRISDRNSARKD